MCPCKFCHKSALGALCRSLHENVVLCLPFKFILIRRWCDLRQVFFEAIKIGLLFGGVSLGPHLAKSQKIRDLGVLAKFVITPLYRHLWSRSLEQNIFLCVYFKCILIRRWCHLPQGLFEAPKVGLLFRGVSLSPPLAKSQKMRDLGVFAKFVIIWLYGHFWSRSLKQNIFLCLHFKCILITRWCHLRQVFLSPECGPTFSRSFPWSPLGKSSVNSRFRCPCQIFHNSALRALLEPQFETEHCPMFALQVRTN